MLYCTFSLIILLRPSKSKTNAYMIPFMPGDYRRHKIAAFLGQNVTRQRSAVSHLGYKLLFPVLVVPLSGTNETHSAELSTFYQWLKSKNSSLLEIIQGHNYSVHQPSLVDIAIVSVYYLLLRPLYKTD